MKGIGKHFCNLLYKYIPDQLVQMKAKLLKELRQLQKQLIKIDIQIDQACDEYFEKDIFIKQGLESKKAVLVERISQIRESLKSLNTNRRISKVFVLAAKETKREISIVPPALVNPRKGHISRNSPLSKALMSRKVGEMVKVETPAGVLRYRIIALR